MRAGFSGRSFESPGSSYLPNLRFANKRILETIVCAAEKGLSYYDLPDIVPYEKHYNLASYLTEIAVSPWGESLESLAQLSAKYKVELTMHAHRGIVLTSPADEIARQSVDRLAAMRAALDMCGGKVLFVSPGYAHGDRGSAIVRLVDRVNSLPKSKTQIGIEVNGKGIGDVSSVLEIVELVEGAVPVLDISALAATGHRFEHIDDYLSLFARVERYYPEGGLWIHITSQHKHRALRAVKNMPSLHMLAQAIWEWELSTGKEVNVMVENQHRERDAVAIREEYNRTRAAYEAAATPERPQQNPEPDKKPRVAIGSSVKVKDLDDESTHVYTIVTPGEVSPLDNRISYASPVGKALVGCAPGTTVEIAVPSGTLRYEILSVLEEGLDAGEDVDRAQELA